MKYGIKENGKIRLIVCDAHFAATQDAVIEVADEVQTGWLIDKDDKIIPPPGPTPAELIAEKTLAIKVEANRRILEIAPEWKQRNMLARGLELQSVGPANWTESQQTEVAALQAIWDNIKAIRGRSDELEEQVKNDPLSDWEW